MSCFYNIKKSGTDNDGVAEGGLLLSVGGRLDDPGIDSMNVNFGQKLSAKFLAPNFGQLLTPKNNGYTFT
jgi:hypothetical protein